MSSWDNMFGEHPARSSISGQRVGRRVKRWCCCPGTLLDCFSRTFPQRSAKAAHSEEEPKPELSCSHTPGRWGTVHSPQPSTRGKTPTLQIRRDLTPSLFIHGCVSDSCCSVLLFQPSCCYISVDYSPAVMSLGTGGFPLPEGRPQRSTKTCTPLWIC